MAVRPEIRQIHLDMIPEFKGEPNLVHRFLDVTTKLINQFYDNENPDNFQNEILLCNIISKIKSPASEKISSFKISNFDDLRNALLTTYSDKRDIYTLTIEISKLKQWQSETPFAFHERLQSLLNTLLSKINSNGENTAAVSEALCNFSRNLSLRVLLQGLKEPIGSQMRTRNPPDLQTAVSLLTNDFQYTNANPTFNNTRNIANPNRSNSNFNNNKTLTGNNSNRLANTTNSSFRPQGSSTLNRNPNNSFRPQRLSFYSPQNQSSLQPPNLTRYVSTPDRARNRENIHLNDHVYPLDRNRTQIDSNINPNNERCLDSRDKEINYPEEIEIENYAPINAYQETEFEIEPEENFLEETDASHNQT